MKKEQKLFRFPIYMGEKLMNAPLEDLDLSPRSSNALRRFGIKTIGELVDRVESPEDLKPVRNLGEKCAREIFNRLYEYQLSVLNDNKREVYLSRVAELNKA